MPRVQKKRKFYKDVFVNTSKFIKILRETLGEQCSIKEDKDSYGNHSIWMKLKVKESINVVANSIKSFKGRCIVATAYKNRDGSHTIIYHFDINGTILNVEIKTNDNMFFSITPIIPSANWAEREIREMYGVEPIGHPNTDRLFLDYSIAKGVLNEFIPLSKLQRGVSKTDIMWKKVEEDINNG